MENGLSFTHMSSITVITLNLWEKGITRLMRHCTLRRTYGRTRLMRQFYITSNLWEKGLTRLMRHCTLNLERPTGRNH